MACQWGALDTSSLAFPSLEETARRRARLGLQQKLEELLFTNAQHCHSLAPQKPLAALVH